LQPKGRTKIQVIHGWLQVVGIPHLNHAKENPIGLLIGKIGPSTHPVCWVFGFRNKIKEGS
jgi:hypothetical protein